MEIYNFEQLYESKIKLFDQDVSIALGGFFSMHLGHQELLRKLQESKCEKKGITLFIEDEESEKRNPFTLEQRVGLLKKYNLDFVILFEKKDKNFSVTKDEFNLFLKESLNVKEVVVGPSFKYGFMRRGNSSNLREHFNVQKIDVIKYNEAPISTTSIKGAIKAGEMNFLKSVLGRLYSYEGTVVKGKGVGRKIGAATINVEVSEKITKPKDGVYFSYAIFDGKKYPSITSIGINPTFWLEVLSYETHILNFDQDIYGKEVKVELIQYVRGQIKFDDREFLMTKIKDDKQLALEFFLDNE